MGFHFIAAAPLSLSVNMCLKTPWTSPTQARAVTRADVPAPPGDPSGKYKCNQDALRAKRLENNLPRSSNGG